MWKYIIKIICSDWNGVSVYEIVVEELVKFYIDVEVDMKEDFYFDGD